MDSQRTSTDDGDTPSPDQRESTAGWRGDEVGRAPAGQAERDAARAADRRPPRPGDEEEASPPRQASSMTPDESRAAEELKRQSAVETHAEDRARGTGTAPKNL
jgi:hypothetical protein